MSTEERRKVLADLLRTEARTQQGNALWWMLDAAKRIEGK